MDSAGVSMAAEGKLLVDGAEDGAEGERGEAGYAHQYVTSPIYSAGEVLCRC